MDDFSRGLSLDGLKASHPIQVEVKSPSEITQIFDAISYCKGIDLFFSSHHAKEVMTNRKLSSSRRLGHSHVGQLSLA